MLIGIIIFIVVCLALAIISELLEEVVEQAYEDAVYWICDTVDGILIFIIEKIESWGPQC